MFKIFVLAGTFRVFATPHICMKTQKCRKAYSSRLRQSDWSAMTHYFLSVSNSYEQNFSSREFQGIFELKKVCITQNKKNFTSVF